MLSETHTCTQVNYCIKFLINEPFRQPTFLLALHEALLFSFHSMTVRVAACPICMCRITAEQHIYILSYNYTDYLGNDFYYSETEFYSATIIINDFNFSCLIHKIKK